MPIQDQIKDNAVGIYDLSEQGFMRSLFSDITGGRTSAIIFLFYIHVFPFVS